METLIQFVQNLQSILAPLHARLFADSASATSSAATGNAGALPETVRAILITVVKVLIWGIDLVDALLVKVLELLS